MRITKKMQDSLTEQQYLICPAHINHYGILLTNLKDYPLIECHIMPFIIDDKRRSRYLRGIKEWQVDRYELVDVVMEAQDRFEAQIELQKLCAHTRFYLPADYTED